MNAKTFFSKLKSRGINDAEYRSVTSSSFSLEVFEGKLNNYTTNTINLITVDAIINNKLVMSTTENLSNKSIDKLIDDLIESSKYTNKKGAEIYKQKARYKKYNYHNELLSNYPIQDKINLIFEIENKVKNYDKRFTKIQVGYDEKESIHEYQNTNNIKIKNKSNRYTISLQIVIVDNKETKVHYEIFIDNDFSKFNINDFVNSACKHAINKLHARQLTSKKYNVIFSPEVTSTLVEYYISQLNAELILKNSSWFKDKLNTLVANPKVTIFESPLKKDADFINADDQGVPTRNMDLIKKGKLLTYLHNLETAKAFNVEPTGHASLTGSKMGIAAHSALYLKQGRLTEEELIKKVNNGIYIKELGGLHAGMNPQNGNFSLKTEGYVIKDGKLSTPLSMMTVNGNLFDIFKNVKAISKNVEYIKNGFISPCINVNKIAISF